MVGVFGKSVEGGVRYISAGRGWLGELPNSRLKDDLRCRELCLESTVVEDAASMEMTWYPKSMALMSVGVQENDLRDPKLRILFIPDTAPEVGLGLGLGLEERLRGIAGLAAELEKLSGKNLEPKGRIFRRLRNFGIAEGLGFGDIRSGDA